MKIIPLLLVLFLPLFSEEGYQIITDQTTLPLLNPALKEQKTIKLHLDNGLEAVIVSDPSVKQSTATLTVLAGSWQDPDEHPGLAHFLEHMLFLGTTEYPIESDFGRFLAEHGGQTNAFTASDYTSYMFSINTSGYAEALNRFASFFKNPLFNSSGVNRELNAIDQEFAQAFNNDAMREYHVLKAVANPLHPVHRFQSGNSQSLSQANTDILRKWFEEKYSANLMRLYVSSSLPLEDLKNIVVKDFSGIKNRKASPYTNAEPLLPDNLRGHLLLIESRTDQQTLLLLWQLPADIPQKLDSKPDDLLCYVLGHEGTDGLLAQLKREGLAEELGCGSLELGVEASLFQIQIKLTAKGLAARDLVVERVFQMLHRLREQPFPDVLFKEYADLMAQRYQYQQRDEPFASAMKQGTWLAREAIATYPELSQTVRRLDRDALKRILEVMKPENALFALAAPAKLLNSPLDQKEPWMQISYAIQPIPEVTLKQWALVGPHADIHLPSPNPFIAQNLNPSSATYPLSAYPDLPLPKLILENAGARIYYSPDPFYQVPRTFLRLQIQSSEIKDNSPQSVVFTDLYIKALEEQTRELRYEGLMADMNVTFERTYGAIQVTLDGYTDSLMAFFPELLKKLLVTEFSSEDFADWQAALQREYDNATREMPVKQTFDFFKAAIFEKYTTVNQKRNAIKKVTGEGFQRFIKKFGEGIFLKGMISGSLSTDKAKILATSVDQRFHPNGNNIAPPYYAQIINLPDTKGPYVINETSRAQGDALLLILEGGEFSPRLRNNQQLLSLAIKEAFFSELRTKQQTGYIVSSDALDLQRHLYNYFAVQSTTHTPEELLWRFEQFLEKYLLNLTTESIPQERFEILKQALTNLLKEPPSSLKAYGEQQFKLAFEVENLNWIKQRLEDLPLITYEDFISAAQNLLGRNNKKRLAIMLEGQKKGKEQSFYYAPLKNIGALRALR